ncbi:MAG: transcriptional regulator [Vicinamibacterales bacterium]
MLTFVETRLFTSLVGQYLSDDDYAALQQALTANPDAGDVIRGSGGVRTLRWGIAGRGKRGGIRVIYYLRSRQGEVWMLTLYAKNEADSIPAHVLRRIKEEIDGGA